jgi:arylsulfatase A-like enzyme
LILRWPAALPAGTTSEQVAITMDLTASILAATGSAVPPGHRLDGIDILPMLRGDSSLIDRQLFWRMAPNRRQQRAVRAGQWKLLVDGGQFLLFDLLADPGERQDLAGRRPDLVVKLRALLEAWEKDVDQKPQARQ